MLITKWEQMPYWESEEFLNNCNELGHLKNICPIPEFWFDALRRVPLSQVRCVIIAKEPWNTLDRSDGLAFSTIDQSRPPALRNILSEWAADTGNVLPVHGDLSAWADQGVLLLHKTPTTIANKKFVHTDRWAGFLPAVIKAINCRTDPVPFLLWGGAVRKAAKILSGHHPVWTASAPDPSTAFHSFNGSRPFSTVNEWLNNHHRQPIDWQLEVK
jgi:uracil-DNA glycosylase